ncbi:hypothetical protein BDV96DRAFT_337192 [Lophiotrema nucula]|uniref:BZIP domain-containing protein n=1 Tax=Lophiotrema nucula TaxID=690887 RepID=A0A6A5YFY5_9PLEO|nr:hypothetical protein BDV96DRAFT_337192 [Lophiotrema nucula]
MKTPKNTPGSKKKSKAAELERVRNNQRRSRARRKDYISELEEKLRVYEGSDFDLKSQRLVAENEVLKKLLHSLGLGQRFIEAYANASKAAVEVKKQGTSTENIDEHCDEDIGQDGTEAFGDRESAESNADIPTTVSDFSVSLFEPGYETIAPLEASYQEQFFQPWEHHSLLTEGATHDQPAPSRLQLRSAGPKGCNQSTNDVKTPGIPELLNSPELKAVENTTLCSLAFSLITTNNRKGIDPMQLEVRLRAGYRPGPTPSDGCRVDNKVLFTVLAEIS